MTKNSPVRFRLPEAVGLVAKATKALRDCYPDSELAFTPDGKFVGDLGEAIAVEMFGIKLDQKKGIDGHYGEIPVQVKTTGRKKGGAAFRSVDESHPYNTHLIVYFIDWERGEGELLFNAPERFARPECKGGQREVSRHQLLNCSIANGAESLRISEKFQQRYMSR